MRARNLFSLPENEQAPYLELWAELLQTKPHWKTLAEVREQAEPYYAEVARRLVDRLRAHPFTQGVGDIEPVFMSVMPYYFNDPPLDREYLLNRARAGRAYLEAGFTSSTLIAKYLILIEEWSRIFAGLFDRERGRVKSYV
ncbi:hypothetical protein [Thermus tengchongensis]|uniref:Uncharacterized protein n=1 Tax=Thermus tengchongensis TaxID=1214928 RepID=A0ABY2K3T9_9DEIN|nr:hypothetical protein [Thermus tengchongensis]TFU14730.1 hypothetical protein E0489_11560 [Thermus tengchongensis]